MVEGRKMYLGKSALQPEINKLKAQAPPSGRVPCLKGAEADGDPAKVDWTKALALGGWRTLEGYSTNRKVKALLIHDHKYLYVQLEEMLDPSKLVSDGGIWMGDDWEVFFAAQRGKPYRQIGVNPMGGHLELAHGETGAWDSGVKVVSNAKVPDRWTVRIALPLDKLLPGGLKPGGKFYANFYRATPNLEELLAWSPNFSSSFHETSRMGELVLE
jgi:hypothetical protein